MAVRVTITQSNSNRVFTSTLLPAGVLDRSQIGVAGGMDAFGAAAAAQAAAATDATAKVATETTARAAADALLIPLTQRGAANGVATLDSGSLIPQGQVPDLSGTYAPRWQPNTAYLAGAAVLNPSGDIVTAIANFTSGSSYNAANWNLSASYTPTIPGLRPATAIPTPRLAMITTFQAGHGWTLQGGTGSSANLNDTTTYKYGTQSLLASVSAVSSGSCTVRAPSFSAIDMTSRAFALLCMVDTPVNLGLIQLTVGNSGYTNFAQIQASGVGGASPTVLEAGVWTWLYFTYADQTSTGGAPTKTGVTDVQIRIQNNNSAAVNVHFNVLATFARPTAFPNGVMSFTFDDCYASHFTTAMPALDAQGWAADEFVIVDAVGTSGRLTQAQLDDMQNLHGWSINPHAYTTANHNTGYSNLTAAQVDADIRGVKGWISANGYRGGDIFATPKGLDSTSVLAQLRQYFAFARQTLRRPYPTPAPDNPLRMRAIQIDATTPVATVQGYIDAAFTNGYWLILVFHDLITSGTVDGTHYLTADYQTIVTYAATKGIPVRTIADVLTLARA